MFHQLHFVYFLSLLFWVALDVVNNFPCIQLDGKYKEYELNPDFRKSKDFPAKLLRGVMEVSLRLLFGINYFFEFFYCFLTEIATVGESCILFGER